ncbi:protein SON isoform X3 [Ahaetulla prasina]|uniref:protein SON isoform X3 n=1 Tax=Ahaetulla prasina TaxID=499056 RepID=UPI0026480355|nr:protein SON isoform X3 [Ahaetulla prasina]
MATNIEQIFRSFVVTKFREIQEQQFGSGKLGNQHNGEINTSGQVNSSDDRIQSIESLQNDSLVQKIEQVLSEVLGTEPRYKSGDGDDIERNNSRSIKRGLSEDVQDEVPRKKSKKDKKHKDKKKKKKRKKEKKEKKYKKHAKETDVQQKECGDMQLISHSNLENSGSLLSAENDIDTHSGSTLKEVSTLINEKTVYENLNLTTLNNMFSSDTSKLDTSEEDSTSISIQEVSEVKLTNEKELEDDSYHPNVTLNICPEDKHLSDAICTVGERVSDISEVEQAKLMLETTDQENIPESSPYCVRGEPEHLETRLESTLNSVTEPVASKNLKETVSTSFEPTGYKFMTLPLESNAEAKDSVTTLGFLAMVVGKDFEATSEFLNTAKVKASERSPKHSSRKGDSVHDSEKTLTIKDLHKPQQFGTEQKDLETASEAVHTVPEKDPELAVVVPLKPQQEVKEFDVQKYNRANFGTEIPKEMKELRETSTLMTGLSESEKNAGYRPIQKDATDLQRAPLVEDMTRIDSEEHLSVVVLEKTNLEVNSDFTQIDTKCLKAKSDGVIESENWKPAPESSKAKNLECVQEFEKAKQINYLETSLETVIENRGNSKIIQHSLALFNVKVPENTLQLKDMNVSETAIQTEVGKIQNLESSKYVDLRNKESKNAEKLKNTPESLMLANNLENSSSELQCIEEIKIVKETSQSDVEAHKKDFKTGLEPEERDVDAGSGSLQMIFANYSEHNLELYTETEGTELKNSDAVLKSLHKSNADNFEPPCAKEIRYVKSTESEAVTEANDLPENLKPLEKHVKYVETASKSIALPTVTYMETLEGTSNRKQSETESHFVQEIEQKRFDSTVKKNQSSADTTDLGLISISKGLIETNSSKIGESESLGKSQGPFISKSLHEIDVISSEKSSPEFKGIAVVQDLKEPGKSLAAAIDPKEFFKLKLVESKEDFPFGTNVKQFESVSESLEQNQEQLEHTRTQIRKKCLDSVLDLGVKCARTSSKILYIDEFNIQEKNKKLEEKIETTGLMEAPESLHLSERDLIVLTSDSGTKVSDYSPETVYLAKTNSETIPKSYEIQMKDSKTSDSKAMNVKDLNIDSEPLLQTGVEIPGCKSDTVEFIAETPRKNEMLPESKSVTTLQNSNAILRSEALTYEHLKTPPASVYIIDTEDLEIPPKSKELDVTEKQGVLTSLFASVESADVPEESLERNYRTDMKRVEASQKSINVEFMGKEKMNDEPVQPSNENDANVSKLFMSSNCGVRAQIIEERLSVANKESVSGITSESGTELLKCSGVSETITDQEREKLDTTLPEFVADVQDLKESPTSLEAREMKNLKANQREKYTKSLYVLESKDATDVSQSGSKVEPKALRATMSYERLSEIKTPVTTAMQLKKPELTSSESVSILEVTDSSKIPELKIAQTYLGVTGFKTTDTTAESCPLEIIDSDSQKQQENILEVKNLESASEIKYGLETHPFKIASESEKVTQDQLSKAISNILSSGNLENLEQILKYRRNQEIKVLESPQFDTTVAKDLKGSLTYEEIIGISEMTTQISKVRDTGSNISAIVPETTEKCSEIFLESVTMSDKQATNANVELDNLINKSPDISTDINKSNSGLIDIMELKCNNASESVHMKELEDFETVAVCKSVIEIKNLQTVQTSGEKEQMDFQELSKSVLPLNTQNLERNSSLPQQKILETSLEPVKDVTVSEFSSTKDIEQNLKSGFVAEGKAQESTVEHVILTQDKSAEIIPQFTLEMKDSEATLESVGVANRKDLAIQISLKEQTTIKPLCMTTEGNVEVNQLETIVLGDSGEAIKPVPLTEKEVIKVGECIETKDSGIAVESEVIVKDKDLEVSVQDSSKYQDSDATLNSSDIIKESDGSNLKDKKSEKISSKSKDKSKSGKKAKKSRSKSPSKSKKRKKKSRSRSTSRHVSRRARSRSKNDSSSKRKHSTSRHKSRSKSVDKKEEKESSLRSRRRRSRTSDRLKSRSKSPDRRETSIRSRRRRSRSSDHKSRSRSVEKRESARRRRRLSRSSDNRRSRSRSVDRRETLTRSRRKRSRSSDHHKSRSRSSDKKEASVRTRRRRSQSSDRCRSRSKSFDRRDSSVRTRRRRSRSSDNPKSRSRSPDDKRELSVRRRGRRSRTPEIRKSRSRSVDRREISGRGRRRRSRSSDNRKSRSRSVDKRESSVRIRRRRSRSSDNRRSKSKSVDKRETSVRTKRRRSVSSDRKSRSRSVDKRETSARSKRRRSRSSDNHKSRSKSVENTETTAKSKRRSKSTDHKSRTKSVEKRESTLNSRHRRSRSSDRPRSKSKSRSKSSERKKDKDSVDGSRGKRSKYRSKSKSLEKTDGTESLEATLNNREKSPEQHKSKSRSRSKSIDKAEKERLRRSRSKGSKSPESRSRRRRTVSRSRRNRSRSLTRKRTRSKSVHRSQSRSRTRSQSRSRRRRTRSRSASRQRSLSRKRHRRSRRNRSRSTERRRRRSDSRDSYRISLRLRSRSRTPVRLRCSRSTGRRRSTSKSPDHRRSRSSSRSPKRLTDLDKAQLLEIAKANAAAMCAKAGVPLPPNLMPVITPEKKEEKVTQKSAKETILELTEKCKKIAQSQEDDVIVNKPHVSDEEEEEHPFINHPFKLNEPKPIFFNLTTPTIKPTPPKNQVTLTKEFPVSSGSQHRKKEADSAYGEWVPVEKNKDENKDDVFPDPANLEPVDISSALTERTIAQKRLTENTFDLEAMCLLNRAQERIDAWAELNSIPGHFTGSTGAQVLTSEQLSNSGPQAWVKKEDLDFIWRD